MEIFNLKTIRHINKKLSLTFISVLFLFFKISAQSYLFEDNNIPSDWSVLQGGTLNLTADHYKEGKKSLCWHTDGTSVLMVTFPVGIVAGSGSAIYQIYTPVITNDTLVVEFISNTSVVRTANYILNYKGWREFNRSFTEYVISGSFTMNAVRMTLKPSSEGERIICFDRVLFNQNTDVNRIIGSQWVLDKSFFKANNEQLRLFANFIDIPIEKPTNDELTTLNDFRNRFKRIPTAGTAAQLTAAKAFATALNIVRNSDGTVKGNPVDMTVAALTTELVIDYVTKLEILAAEGLKNPMTLDLFRDLLDHLMEQGFGEGVGFSIRPNEYTPSRTIPSKLLNLLPACTDNQKIEVLKLVRWLSFYGLLYEPEESYMQSLNSDIIYLFLPHLMGIAIFQPDDALAVRELKAFKRFLERNTAYVPGGKDILKPDGTGFHHQTHYVGYMYSYNPWTQYMGYLKGTPFRLKKEAYERFKKAVLSQFMMATSDQNNTRHFANTLAGRKPFDTGIYFYYTRDLFDSLIAIGGDILGKELDEELAAAYNFFFQTNKYNVPEKIFDGFYQFNYSPMGIYRRKNWVVTMRAPTTKFWGAEIYGDYNRFGRYQSHGTLDVTYDGTTANSGYPMNNGGGWDWNVVPGTTTVHYTSWKDMMPAGNTSARFDQYSKTKNFSGALSWGDCGIFAADFNQCDSMWGSLRFTPTNLEFKKSMYAFDNMIISLGSDIVSSGSYSNDMITATNLFQNIISSVSGPLLLNGVEIPRPNKITMSSEQDNWIITPQETGYFIPKGNDEVSLIHDSQLTPRHSGVDYASPVVYAYAAKAFINHGLKPSGKKYCFVVLPATNGTEMQYFSSKMANNGGSIYKVHAQHDYLHALTYLPKKITAYTFFGPNYYLSFGIVKSSTTEHLLMHRHDDETGRQYFAASNPNLNPVDDANYSWKSTPTQTTLTLYGEWLPVVETEGVKVHIPVNGETKVTLNFKEGEPLYFALKRPGDTALDIINDKDMVKYRMNNDYLWLVPSDNFGNKTVVSLYSAVGKLSFQKVVDNVEETLQIPLSNLMGGIYVCLVQDSYGKSASFKFIK